MADARQMTLKDKAKLEEELAGLIEEKKKVAEDIKTARGFGDLSENSEYDEAKANEARVYGRIAELEYMLSNAQFVDDSAVSNDITAVGTVVETQDMEFGDIEKYTLVGFTEADPDKLFVSQESPVGEALIGKHVGDIVTINTPGGAINLKILTISLRD